jgi:pimeloyl-ACP methyl ester carboxylesterase
MRTSIYTWGKRMLVAAGIIVFLVLFAVFPLGASFLITNSRFHFPERGPKDPQQLGLNVTAIVFQSSDGIELHGWWIPGNPEKPVIIFCHGLNRSRLEMLERAAEASRLGYGILLFDLRNHGESGRAYTTLGILEQRDVCAASQAVRDRAGSRSQVLWGVSMGASTAILAAKQCPPFAAIIADSSFLSFRETVSHHLKLIFRLPSFPISNLIDAVTAVRTGINLNDGDVEAAVKSLPNVPILFIAGGNDRRMPPALAERLRQASSNPGSQMLLVPGASHGEAYNVNKTLYLNTVFTFLDRALHQSS